jgi:CheY-like chemotaxis protein
VRLIAASTSELLDAVNGLLDIARAEAGKIQPDLTTVDVAGLVADLRTTLRTLTPPGVDLVVHVRDNLGAVVTDGVLLAQLVRNLISNALKFTEAGQVVVTVATQRIDGADYIDVEVADTGIGIAPEHHDLVFEEFYRVPGHLQVRARSTGLGLPYARRVATALGGSLTLTSAPGRGSTFRARVRNHHQPDGAGIDHRLSSVLVGDDDAACREMLRGLLTTVADVVVEATDAEAVLAALTDATPDLVLLDLRMPGGGGARVLAEIDQHPEWREVAVVVISSSDVELGELRTQRPGLVTVDKAVLDRESLARAIAMTSAGAA